MHVPFGVISDSHNHAWNQFDEPAPDGTSGRLKVILDETRRAAHELTAQTGSKKLFHGGDLFHVRGKIAPSVLNPTKDLYRELIAEGYEIFILAGNHDLEGKEASRLGSAVTALEDIGCTIVNQTKHVVLGPKHEVIMIPWHNKVADLKVSIEESAKYVKETRDVIDCPIVIDLMLHAPIDGVIVGLPDHGIDNAWLAGLGFDRVFSGHYHNFKDFGNGVYSIGALTHHSWGDIGSKAGHLIVTDKVTHRQQHAPSFIEINGLTDPDEIPLLVPGNYVRAKINSAKTSDVNALRDYLEKLGAKGVVILSQKEATSVRDATPGAATIKTGESLEASLAWFITNGKMKNESKLQTLCSDLLMQARSEMEV